ncbi:MAG: hypothetical protein J0I99_00630 [Devosia sp.]|uniref:hypothetical protein n=1 Tax=Devosia sp. TaxID=1871048 RepID=UPI001ACC2933|nr:hypothetical protein [Devosia sp.]MBN9314222.1 hypothetical protein [Devosia sp.]
MANPLDLDIAPPPRDLDFAFMGSIVLCTPVTDVARTWIDDHVSEESMWYGGSLCIEPRYLDDFVAGAMSDGLVCKAD